MKVTEKITITNEDNMELMARYPDNYFDLAIVDPPYGLGLATVSVPSKKNTNSQQKFYKDLKNKMWDNSTPNKEYFDQLKRVSKHQIVWGGNYMAEHLGNTKCILIWDKMTYIPTMSQFEFAFCSMNKHPQLIKLNSNDVNRQHPTQKPVGLYKWLLDKYAKQGDKILDTHLGSGSIAIACHDYGFELTACELDAEYYEKAIQRIKNHTNQMNLFL
jgi:site-specific DNA-methyltransferase (adenine-specific)